MVIYRRAPVSPESSEAIKQKEHDITPADVQTVGKMVNEFVNPEIEYHGGLSEEDEVLITQFNGAMGEFKSRDSQHGEAAHVVKMMMAGGLNHTEDARKIFEEVLPEVDGDTFDALSDVWVATLPGRGQLDVDSNTNVLSQVIDNYVSMNSKNPSSRLLLHAFGLGLTRRNVGLANARSVAMQQEIEK